MNSLKKMLPYILVMILDFYLMPLLIKDTGLAILMLLVVIPFICLVCSIIYGSKNGFNLLFCVIVTLLYVPTIFVFYNSSAWVYVVGYGVVTIVGNFIGMLINKRAQ